MQKRVKGPPQSATFRGSIDDGARICPFDRGPVLEPLRASRQTNPRGASTGGRNSCNRPPPTKFRRSYFFDIVARCYIVTRSVVSGSEYEIKSNMRNVRAQTLVLAALLATAMPHPALSAAFVLVNLSGQTIDQLYISPCGGRHWGPNQLYGAPVWSSRSFTVSNIEPGCYDVMVVLQPWNECIVAGAALRSRSGLAWTITRSTVTQAVF